MNKTINLLLGFIFAMTSQNLYALTASTQGAVSNDFLFIENNIDNEYFITPSSLDPRISGSNTWVKYGDKQESLGYIGLVGWTANTNYYKDIWIDGSPINEPFNGIRCTSGANCPSSGYISADLVDKYGFYHTKATGAGTGGGAYGFASLTESAFEYFKSLTVGSSETLMLNFCRTQINFDYSSGARCKDQSSGNWYIRPYTLNKIGQLTLVSTNAFQELWIASDGTPSISKDSGYCELGTVSGTDGVICKMVAYSFNQIQNLSNSLYIQMYADSSLLGFSPAASTVKFSGDTQTWYNYSATTTRYHSVLKNGGEYIYVFLSKTFLKNMVDRGVSISNGQPFTFSFRNTATPESGYYQFSPSLHLDIIPKEYGISIKSKDNSFSSIAEGTIGDNAPIEMDYIITISGPRQADSITAQVIGDATTISGIPYCLFKSLQDNLSVPIPAYLQYITKSGGIAQKRNSCSEDAIEISDALWQQTPWDANNTDDGNYFNTDLKIMFPMNDSHSLLTVSGTDWEGIVNATGEIKVTANWLGVTP